MSETLDHIEALRSGDVVFTSDRHRVGKLHEVIVDADTDELTSIVVNTGPFFPMPGFGAPNLVRVPLEEIEDMEGEKVLLRCSKPVFEHFPLYTDWIIGLHGRAAWKIRDRRPSEREIARGARIWRLEPHLYIGNVEEVLLDEDTEELKALVIQRGVIFGHNVVLPIDFVVDFDDEKIHVQLTDAEIESLAKYYEPPDE